MPEEAITQTDLLDPAFMRRLEQLQLLAKRVYVGAMKGERRSPLKGESIEFADYRPYVQGDDLRFIDWNIYGRSDRLFLKLFHEEQDLNFYVLLDTSRSMDFGEPKKILFGKKIAAALAYIGLVNLDRVCVGSLTSQLADFLPPTRGKHQARKLLEFLSDIEAAGQTSLAYAIKRFLIRFPTRGLVVLISDFLDPDGYEDALKLFLQRRCEVFVIHVLAPDDLEPDVAGNLKLVDCETGQFAEVTVNQYLLNHYRDTVNRFRGSLRQFCAQRGITYLGTTSSTPVERLILDFFRRRGLLK